VESWESEALRNLNMEKRRCLGVSSWIGGESGRSIGSSIEGLGPCLEEEGLSSLGGVTGGAGMLGFAPFEQLTGSGERADADDGSSTAELVLEGGRGGCLPGRAKVSGSRVCRRMSDSLAWAARQRRKGMISGGG